MEIRKAKKGDLNKISKIGNEVREFKVGKDVVTFWPKKTLAKIIASKKDLIFIAEQEKKIIGFIIVNYNSVFGKAIIENVIVRKEFRKMGIAKELLDNVLRQLKKQRCSYVSALANSKEKEAINWYIKRGFNKGDNFVWMDIILGREFKRR